MTWEDCWSANIHWCFIQESTQVASWSNGNNHLPTDTVTFRIRRLYQCQAFLEIVKGMISIGFIECTKEVVAIKSDQQSTSDLSNTNHFHSASVTVVEKRVIYVENATCYVVTGHQGKKMVEPRQHSMQQRIVSPFTVPTQIWGPQSSGPALFYTCPQRWGL